MGKIRLKKLLCTGLLGGSMLMGGMVEAGVITDRLPLTCYADHKVITYNSPGAKSAGYISANVDLIQIMQVRGDGWCYGSYPGAGGRSVSRWFKITDICADAGYTNRSANVKGRQTVYRTKSGGATIGSVSNNEDVIVVADNGRRAQIVYRLDNGTGYKLGWVPSVSVVPSGPTPVPTQSHNPEGNFEGVESKGANQITVSGWTMDRDDVGKSLRVHVYVGGGLGSGAESYEIVANKSRPDVQNWYLRRGLRTGIYYGFNDTIRVKRTGRQDVYVYAINIEGGKTIELGHKTLDIKSANINHNPQGVFESYGTMNNALRVIGWAKDDDNLNHKVRVHVYIGGAAGDSKAYSKEIIANKSNNACPGHGFDETLFNIPDKYCGRQTVRLYALNDVGAGTFQEIGAKVISIPSNHPVPNINNRQQAMVNKARKYLGSSSYNGYCQRFVKVVGQGIGLPAGSASSALDACNKWRVATDRNIPVGAVVYLKGRNKSTNGYKYGHVGIYAGNGMVIHALTTVREQSLDSLLKTFDYLGWGWQAGVDLR